MYTYTRSRRVCTRQAAHLSAPVGTRAGAALAPPRASNCAQARPASPGRCFFCAPWVDVPIQSPPALVPPPPALVPLPPPPTEVDVPVQSPPQWTCRPDEAGSQPFLALVARLTLTKCRLLLPRPVTRIATTRLGRQLGATCLHSANSGYQCGRWGSFSFCGVLSSAATRPLALCTPVHAASWLSGGPKGACMMVAVRVAI